MAKDEHCALCRRRKPLTFHHFIPRQVHSNKWFKKNFTRQQMQEGVDVCRDCHSAIHRFIPNHKQLARQYNSTQALREHPEVANFVQWVSRRGRS